MVLLLNRREFDIAPERQQRSRSSFLTRSSLQETVLRTGCLWLHRSVRLKCLHPFFDSVNFRCALVISGQIGWNETRIGTRWSSVLFDRRGGV